MRILMFGWEFPPFSSGGLGTACYGLTKGLSRQGVEITLVLPYSNTPATPDYMRILFAKTGGKIKLRHINSILKPYLTSESYYSEVSHASSSQETTKTPGQPGSGPRPKKQLYGEDLFHEVYRYSQDARRIAMEEDFDVIHCHDWMTYQAGVEAKKAAAEKGRNVPLVCHVHSTEFDRTGGSPHQYVYDLERAGIHGADYVVAVSNYTKNIIVERYGVPEGKVHVIHNSIDPEDDPEVENEEFRIRHHYKTVLFLGRMTIQKGPDHFLRIAKKISEVDDSVRFIMVGSGDMFRRVIEEAADMGIGDRVLFTDFLSGRDVDRAYRIADVYVMPSVSEPFGLAALEAMKNKTPAVVSKQSGVSEIIRNCLTADFWDVDEMANRVLAVINYPALRETLVGEGLQEIKNLSWDTPAKKCMDVYEKGMREFSITGS